MQSSIRQQFGLAVDTQPISAAERGISTLMVDLYRTFADPLTHELLYKWHHQLIPSTSYEIQDIGRYRTHEAPMQILSGRGDVATIHFDYPRGVESGAKKEDAVHVVPFLSKLYLGEECFFSGGGMCGNIVQWYLTISGSANIYQEFFVTSPAQSSLNPNQIARIQQIAQAIRANVANVIVGKENVVDLLLVALFSEGHVLLEDVPGTGKTMLARSLARSLGCSFQRIQFTPDLLPSDISGVSVFNQQSNQFDYRAGPIMAQLVLADEINRAGPRTQSALLEAMEERQVTVDGETRKLPYPFLVLATQNPVELEGTFPLPEAQVDRFLIRLSVGYPDREEERNILRRFRSSSPLEALQHVVTTDEIREANQHCREVFVHPLLEGYLLDLIHATRDHDGLALGASPRGSLALYRTSQALAAIRNRTYVTPDDIKEMAHPVLAHRLIPNVETRLQQRPVAAILQDLLDQIPVPVEENWAS